MLNEPAVNLGNLLLSFSDAIDLANQSISAHQMRTTFIAWQMAKRAKLSKKVEDKIFIGALLHDAGALTTEDKTKLHSFEEINTENHCNIGALLFKSSPLLEPYQEWSDFIISHGTNGKRPLIQLMLWNLKYFILPIILKD